MRREYGRCVGRVYHDTPSGTKAIGWVFQSRVLYEGERKATYLREVWVTVHTAPPTRTVEYHYLEQAA